MTGRRIKRQDKGRTSEGIEERSSYKGIKGRVETRPTLSSYIYITGLRSVIVVAWTRERERRVSSLQNKDNDVVVAGRLSRRGRYGAITCCLFVVVVTGNNNNTTTTTTIGVEMDSVYQYI